MTTTVPGTMDAGGPDMPSYGERVAVAEVRIDGLRDDVSQLATRLEAHSRDSKRRHAEILGRLDASSGTYRLGILPGTARELGIAAAVVASIVAGAGGSAYLGSSAAVPPQEITHARPDPTGD